METGTISLYKRAIFILFVVVVPAACRFDNEYSLNVTCDRAVLKIQFQFEKPFRGFIFADKHKFEPGCSFRAPPMYNTSEVNLNINLPSCGPLLHFKSNVHTAIKMDIRIQQHNILKTYNDITQPVYCLITDEHSKSQIYSKPMKRLPKVVSELEIKKGYEALGTKLASELNIFEENLLVFKIPNDGWTKDIYIKNCMVHEKKVLDEDSFFYQITHPSGCQNTSSDSLSEFKVVNNTETGKLTAYAQIRDIKPLVTGNLLFVSCGAQFCKRTCRNKCPRKAQRSDVVTAVATHRISKRSVDISDLPTQLPTEVGNRFMISTIKALSQKLYQQAKAQNKTKFEKRALNISPNENSIPADIGFPAFPIKNSDAGFTNSSRDYESIEDMDQLEEDDYEDLLPITTDSTVNITQSWPNYQNNSLRSNMKMIIARLEDLSQKMKQKKTFSKHGMDEEYTDSSETDESETPAFLLTNFDVKSNGDNQALVTVESSVSTEFEITNIETFDLTTLPSSSLQDTDVTATETKLELGTKELTSKNESLTVNCSMHLSNAASVELDFEQPLNHHCVPHLTFLIVSIVLGFIIFTLLLVCCGMVLYIKKEKKRHLIDNFLLYSFY